MLEDAAQLLEHGADGIAFGFLHEDGTIDIKRCQKNAAGDRREGICFSPCNRCCSGCFRCCQLLSELGVTRILTSGQKPTALEGAETIRQMIRIADGRIEILPGSGIRPHNSARCRELFQTPFLHASMHTIICDNSLAHRSEIHFHGNTLLPETQYKIILPENVADLINQANKN